VSRTKPTVAVCAYTCYKSIDMTVVGSVGSFAAALLGGALIGAAASLLLRLNGRIAGISGIVAGLFSREQGELGWRAQFVAGLLAGGVLVALVHPGAFAVAAPPSPGTALAGGLLVGLGTRVSGGCTSGHGVCGISRLSIRSLAATLTFLAAAMVTVFLVRHTGGPR
jgi:uncharacterized membrane protein YedE/YeeE